jgi:hypothetical protein
LEEKQQAKRSKLIKHMKKNIVPRLRAWVGSILLLVLPITTASAVDIYILPAGAGSKNGSSWANARSWNDEAIGTLLNTTMKAGDRLLLGSGTYLNKTLSINSSGTSTARKTIEGVDRGSGLPIIDPGTWTRTNPDAGPGACIALGASGPDYWTIKNLRLQDAQNGVDVSSSVTSQCVGNQFIDVSIRNTRHPMYLCDFDSGLLRRVHVYEYTKHGIRFEERCDNNTLEDCIADLSNGDDTWYDYSEPIPFGFLVNNGGVNTNIFFDTCVAKNHRRNGQATGDYWNGDGFVVEGGNTGVSFDRCRSRNNEDGGYDLKPQVTVKNCVGIQNKRNFRFWNGASTATNCVSAYTTKRGGDGSRVGYWIEDATPTLNYCTAHDDAGTLVSEEATGSVTVTNSLLSFTGATGTFRSGSGTEAASVSRYRPGSGTNPNYINPTSSWFGVGTNMDSATYGTTKGYNSTSDGTNR